MAAYAALDSLRDMIDRLQQHPSPPISFYVQAPTQIPDFLLEFLQGYNPPVADGEEPDPLLRGIADAAYAAEDVLESWIVDKIKDGESTIKDEAMKTEKAAVHYNVVSDSGSPSSRMNKIMIGFDDVFLETMDKLTAGRVDRQVIPLVGVGGIGTTTLARNIFAHPLIKEHFDVCAWATVSHEYTRKEILCEVLSQAQKDESKQRLREKSEDELGLELQQYLYRRRFLIVMDDMWSIEAWDKIKWLFPDDSNGSRILVTTRHRQLGSMLDKDSGPQMNTFDLEKSWNLFSQIVFGEKCCTTELKEIAWVILKKCQGFPLSIVVAGSLLKRLERTPKCWRSILYDLSCAVNLKNDKKYLKVFEMSCNYLQAHLKPCLHMGAFEEDSLIPASTLNGLWDCLNYYLYLKLVLLIRE